MPYVEEAWSIYCPTSSLQDSVIFPGHLVALCQLQNNDLVVMCLVYLELYNLQLISKIMALLLFSIIMLCAILFPCVYMKYIDHSMLSISLYTPIRSLYVNLFPFIFCFLKRLDTFNLPRDNISTVCLQ